MSDILKMFLVVMKSLFKKTACEMYPLKKSKIYQRTRGHIAIEPSKCILCTLCDKRCPTGAIKVDRAGRKWEIDRFKCILCNICVESCRPNCLIMLNQYSPPCVTKEIESIDIPVIEKEKNGS